MFKTQYFRKAFCVWSTMISILPESLIEALGLSGGSCKGSCVKGAAGGIDPLTIALLFVTCLVTWHCTTFFWNALQVLAAALKRQEAAHEYFHREHQVQDSLEERSPPRAIFRHVGSPMITRYQLQQNELVNQPRMLQAKQRSKSKVDCRVQVEHHCARHATSATTLTCSSRTYSQDTSYSWCPDRDYLPAPPARSRFVYNNPPDVVLMPSCICCSEEFRSQEPSKSGQEPSTNRQEPSISRQVALTSRQEPSTSSHEAHYRSRHEACYPSRQEPSTSGHGACYPSRQKPSTSGQVVSTPRLVRVLTLQGLPTISSPQPIRPKTKSEITQTKHSDIEQALNKCRIVRSTRSGAVYGIYY